MGEFNRRKLEAIEHINFCCMMYEYEVRRGKHFLHEHPWTARSWKLPGIPKMLRNPAVNLVEGHMCQFRMMTHIEEKDGKMGLVKKPTGFMTSSKCIAQALNVRCIGGHDHVPLVGGRAAGAAIYPKMLCQAIVNGVIKQKIMDASLIVDTVKMDKGHLSSFAIGICSEFRRGRISVQHGGCSSVVRENGVN